MTHLLLAAFLAIRVGSNVPETPARGPQMAAQGSNVVMTFGAGDAIYFSSSKDSGATFSVLPNADICSTASRRSFGLGLSSDGDWRRRTVTKSIPN